MLEQLNQRAKLKKPLIGDLSATLHLFHATKDYTDIEEFFNSTVLPLPVSDSTVRSLEVPPVILPFSRSSLAILPFCQNLPALLLCSQYPPLLLRFSRSSLAILPFSQNLPAILPLPQYLPALLLFPQNPPANLPFFPVFTTGQSVRPEPGRGRTAVGRPVRSFSKVARQVGLEDEDGRHSVVPSGLFRNLPHTSE